jgi:hypothetical protein
LGEQGSALHPLSFATNREDRLGRQSATSLAHGKKLRLIQR